MRFGKLVVNMRNISQKRYYFQKCDVQFKLLDLFESEHMSGSIKIQIVKALDSTTRFKDGMYNDRSRLISTIVYGAYNAGPRLSIVHRSYCE